MAFPASKSLSYDRRIPRESMFLAKPDLNDPPPDSRVQSERVRRVGESASQAADLLARRRRIVLEREFSPRSRAH